MLTSLTFLVSVGIVLLCLLLFWIIEAGPREFWSRAEAVLIVVGVTALALNWYGLRDRSVVLAQSIFAAVRQIRDNDSKARPVVFAETYNTPSTIDQEDAARQRRFAEDQQRRDYERMARQVDRQSRSGPGYVGSHEWRKEQNQPGYYYEMMKK